MQRRIFVRDGALALVTMGLSPSFLRRATFGARLEATRKGKILVQGKLSQVGCEKCRSRMMIC